MANVPGLLLRRERRAAGLTQEELAERIGYSVSHIRKLEQGSRKPTTGTIEELARALNVSEDVELALKDAWKTGNNGSRAGDALYSRLPEPFVRALSRLVHVAEVRLSISRGWLRAIAGLLVLLLVLLIVAAALAIILAIRDLTASPAAAIRAGTSQARIIPGGVWISPKNGARFTRSVLFAAHAYPTNPDDPPIKYVIFTAWWRGFGGGPWAKVCWLRKPVHYDVYQCTWTFRWQSRAVPAGPIKISFDVYDKAGNRNLAPNGVHTIFHSPRH